MNAAISQPRPSVLVVDDEHALRRIIRVALTANGFAVEEARHGQEALEAVRRISFNLVLLDMNMPGLGGIETCRQIRSFAPEMGIVMLTVRDTAEDKVQAFEAGANEYVTKPFRFDELKARMAALLQRLPAETSEEVEIAPERSSLLSDGKAAEEFDHPSFPMTRRVPRVRGHKHERLPVRQLRRKIENESANLGDPGQSPAPFEQAKLTNLRIDQLRRAIRANLVSFPSQVPTFKKHDRSDLQQKLVQLYFVLGWSCDSVAIRYGLVHQRVRQILATWKRRAVATGYIQYIPPTPSERARHHPK